MKIMPRLIVSLAAGSMCLGAHTALANSTQTVDTPRHSMQAVSTFAKQVERELAAKGVRVFIIARVGRPAAELPPGFHYTHTAFGVYSMIQTADGRQVPGYAIYNLYQRNDAPAVSDLVVDYPADFFAGAQELKAGIIIPTPQVQRRLMKVIDSPTYAALHNPHYSAIASPYTLEYQNCTEFTLDVLNAAVYDTADEAQLKANASAYFQAQPVKVNGVKLALGSMFMPDITTSDHKGPVRTATFTSIARYMQEYGLAQETLTITPDR